MKRIFILISLGMSLASCKKEQSTQEETFIKGTTEIMVEESVIPLAEDIISVFETQYEHSKFEIKPSHEAKLMNAIFQDSIRLAIIPRELSQKEKEVLAKRVKAVVTPIAKEAIVFVGNKKSNDTLIDYNKFIEAIKDPNNKKIFVFDNVNSSVVRKIRQDVAQTNFGKNVYFMKNTKEVIEYISTNPDAIGIIGSNWLAQPDEDVEEYKKSIRGLYVLNTENKQYYKATQSTIADNSYPLIRTINIIDVKGNAGLGKGLASFAAGDRGQRLVLKSGLIPIKMPTREINVNIE